MDLEPYKYYHLYNRSNNTELLFKIPKNYLYFLKSFRNRFETDLRIFAYCLMPTHIHFLIEVNTEDTDRLKKQIGIHLSSYTKAINRAFQRHGSLFQQHTKAKLIDDESYLLTLMSYIHQNPIRSNLVDEIEEWPFSSYRDLAGHRNGTLVDKSIIDNYFPTIDSFIRFSKLTVTEVKSKYWIKYKL